MCYHEAVELWTLEFHGTRVQSFIGTLDDDRGHDEANALIRLLGVRGNRLGEPRSKSLGDGLFELRGKTVRIFYTFRPGRRIGAARWDDQEASGHSERSASAAAQTTGRS